jgi:hypothetical protein
MSEAMTPSNLRSNLFNILDQVLQTGEPVEIKRKGSLLKICRVADNKLDLLKPHPDTVNGDSDEIAGMDWSSEWNCDLP